MHFDNGKNFCYNNLVDFSPCLSEKGKDMTKKRYAVIGAGHGGKAVAADLAARGFAVNLYNRTEQHITEIGLRRAIELEREDGTVHTCPLDVVTADISEALDDVQVVMVVVPAIAHRDVARLCASRLRSGQTVILTPGRTGGALEFRHILTQMGCAKDVIVAETGTFLYSSRSTGPAQAIIFRRKNAIPLAAFPASQTNQVLEQVHDAFPQFIPAANVLLTGLDNMGAVFHPALTLLNAGWIERTMGDFGFYTDGVTPSTARMLEVLDQERVNVASALGVHVRPAMTWLKDAYSAVGETIYEAIQANAGYQGINAPRNLRHRYLFEDVPFSLVPLASLGAEFGVETWATEAMIRLACVMQGIDYFERGRTVEDMGLRGLPKNDVWQYVTHGIIHSSPAHEVQ